MTLLPSEALVAADCGNATQALLVRTYLQRDRRRPASRRESSPVLILEPVSPAPQSVDVGPHLRGDQPASRPTPQLPAIVPRPPVDGSLLRLSLAGWPAIGRPPAALRSALAFIEARAAEPIGLTEIAAAAQLSPRALQVAFRKHLGTTPLGHLRAVRLARVHADLQSALSGDGQTVSAVANRWGFSQLSRFARDYKRRYGVLPRQTLARSAP